MDFYEQNILNQAFNLHSAEMTEWTFRRENTWKHVILLTVRALVLTVLAVLAGPAGSGHWAGFQAILPPIFRVAVWRGATVLPVEVDETLAYRQRADSLGRNTTTCHLQSSPPNHYDRLPPTATAKFHLQSLRGNNFNTTSRKTSWKTKMFKTYNKVVLFHCF